jgi:hypothetical protein
MSNSVSVTVNNDSDHRKKVLEYIAKLWEQHPDHSFCDLINWYIISIGTMASHTSDQDVIERCAANSVWSI